MKILSYNDRETLKKNGVPKDGDFARYHRFIGDLIGGSGFEIDAIDVPISFEDYQQLMLLVPGWSYGRVRPGTNRWRDEFYVSPPPMNRLYEEAVLNRKLLCEKYPQIKSQEDSMTI